MTNTPLLQFQPTAPEALIQFDDYDEAMAVSGDSLRAARRPKPPSLKEQALAVLTQYMTGKTILTNDSVDTIRRALEALDD